MEPEQKGGSSGDAIIPGFQTLITDPSDVSNVPRIDEEKNRSDSVASHSSSESIGPASNEPNVQLSQTRSQTPSQRRPVAVLRADRRGLLARFCFVAEVKNPYAYKNSTKWFITFVVALAAAAAPMGSAIFYPALPEISRDFHASSTVTNLSVAMYMLSMAIFPLWWSSFSETLGRRTIYITSFALFTIWNIVSAESTSITMLIITRVLSGGASASVQAVGAGTVADLWESKERGKAMGVFYLGPLLGPLLAPIIGGVLAQYLGWRSTQWFQTIYGGVLFVLITLCLPETLKRIPDPSPELPTSSDEKTTAALQPLAPVTTRHSVAQKTAKGMRIFKRCIIDPLSVLLYLRFPAVLLTVLLASVAFATLYFLNISVQATFSESPYNFQTIIIGLLYIPNSLGYVVSSFVGGRWSDHLMHRASKARNEYDSRGRLTLKPEDRIQENMIAAALIFPGALIWYGWTVDKGVFWLVPMIANFFFGLGSMIVFGTCTTVLTEFMPKKSSSGVAVNNFVRNIFSCTAGIVAQPLITAIGNGWLFTILGLVSYLIAFGVILFIRRNGARWRVEMEKKMG